MNGYFFPLVFVYCCQGYLWYRKKRRPVMLIREQTLYLKQNKVYLALYPMNSPKGGCKAAASHIKRNAFVWTSPPPTQYTPVFNRNSFTCMQAGIQVLCSQMRTIDNSRHSNFQNLISTGYDMLITRYFLDELIVVLPSALKSNLFG